MPVPDYSGVTKDIQGGYDAQRQKAAQTEGAALQGQRDALARRQAALGNAPGGAFVQAEQQAGNDSAHRLQDANAGIDQAQDQELRGVHMTQLGQQFTSSERQASQDFAASQSAMQRRIEEGGLTGTYNGQQTLAAKTAADQHALAVGGLTGTYGGQDTLAKTTADQAHAAQIGQLTGTYNGADTLAKQGLDASNVQNQFENAQNIKTSAFNAMQALVAANYNGGDIKKLIMAAFPGFDINQLGDISRITANGPGQGGTPAGVAPRPVAAGYNPPPQDRTAAGYDS